MTDAASKLGVDVCAPIAAGLVYLLTYPTADGRALPSAEDAAARGWMDQVRALLQRACAADGARITHVVFSGECALASPVLALLQQSQAAHGLPAAQLFHAEHAQSPRAMLDELLRCWHHGATGDPADVDADDDAAMAEAEAEADAALHTPTVSSALFRRSLRETRLPRLLLLAPGLRHAFNEALHLRMQALDANAHRQQINADQSHSYSAAITAAAAAAAGPAAAAAAEPASDPQVACSSSVFGVSLCAPVLLEYALYRSALSGVWSSMRRLECALEERLRQAAAAAAAAAEAAQATKGPAAPHAPAGRLPGTHYPLPLLDGGGAAAGCFVVRPCRIYTYLGSHALHSVLLVAVDVATAPADETTAPAPVLQPLQSLAERVSGLRAQSAWAGPRTFAFDDSAAGRALAAACRTAFGPAFAFRASFLPFASAMGVYDAVVRASPLAPLVLFGSAGDLEPLLSLLLNQGRRANVAVDKHAVRATMLREHGVVDVQHCHPELPSTLTTRSPMPPPISAAPTAHDRDRDAYAHSQSRFQVSRVLNAQYASLSSLPV